MVIQLFNFLEDYNKQIVNLLMGKIPRNKVGYKNISKKTLEAIVEQLLDGFIDVLVTGQVDALDKTYHLLARIIANGGSKLSDVFDLPLILTSVIRRLLAEEYSDLAGEDAVKKFNQALEQVENTGHRAACYFLDVFQEHMERSIFNHNDYLIKMEKEYNVDISSFKIGSELDISK